MLSVAEARARAARVVERSKRAWAAAIVASDVLAGPNEETLTFALRPPTEKAALADTAGAIAWVAQWREAERAGIVRVAWAQRSWPSVGAQTIPERASLHGADAIAAFAGSGAARSWRVVRDRATVIRARLIAEGSAATLAESLSIAVRTHAGTIGDYAEEEFEELLQVVEWLIANPASGRRIRELPIRGIHTKWLERHRKVTEDLYRALTARDGLGLAESQSLIRIRFLDQRLRPGGLSDAALPPTELQALDIAPDVVFVFENLETVLAMPELAGAVAVHGGGYAAGRVVDIPWVKCARIIYWGDLDSDGFRILDNLRAGGAEVESIFMDAATVERYRDLAVTESRQATGERGFLTAEEEAARVLLAGGMRIEQERLPWAEVLPVLQELARGIR